MKDETAVKITAIAGIVVLEGIALATHTDGAFFGPAIAVIGGVAGYELRGLKEKIQVPEKQASEG